MEKLNFESKINIENLAIINKEDANINEEVFPSVIKEDKERKENRVENLRAEIFTELNERGAEHNKVEEIEINKEFLDKIISIENKRYQSPEALSRAKKIDADFPASMLENIFFKYISQEKNCEYTNQNPSIVIGDWLEAGGHYQKQESLVSRSKDFIEISDRAGPEQTKQILAHEYNHMFTQGQSNFSEKYKQHIRSIFLSDKELKSLKKQGGYEFLFEEAYKGSGPVYEYLTAVPEINAYLGTNLRNDLLRNGITKNFYDKIDGKILDDSINIKDSNCNRATTPIYKIYFSIMKDKNKLLDWLNNYAI